MARFQGKVSGARGTVTRLGHASSGILAVANGWNLGAEIQGRAVGDDDYFELYATRGSHGNGTATYLGRIVDVDGTPTFEPVHA